MVRPPMNLTLDQGDPIEIDNGSLASFQFLSRMDHLQHSLGSQFMGPPILFSPTSAGLAADQALSKMQVMVPPNCTHAHVFIWGVGGTDLIPFFDLDATVTFTTAVDTVGTQLQTLTNTVIDDETAGAFDQTTQTGTATSADEKTWLKLVSSASWEWQVVEVTMVLTAGCYVFSVGFLPVHNEWE